MDFVEFPFYDVGEKLSGEQTPHRCVGAHPVASYTRWKGLGIRGGKKIGDEPAP
jgi:hypothetical protein